jgi:hypothetical protein
MSSPCCEEENFPKEKPFMMDSDECIGVCWIRDFLLWCWRELTDTRTSRDHWPFPSICPWTFHLNDAKSFLARDL